MADAGSKVLIVNADDLGRTPGINAGIFEAHERGIVTSATLMVGFPAAEAAARELPRLPRLGVGLHVALTGARPLLPPERVPSLVGPDGAFPPHPSRFVDLDPGEVRSEVEAQFARFQQLTGRLPTHLDSHHHSHRHPVVCEALIEVAKRHGLPVRNASPEVDARLLQAGVPTTDAFIERFYGPDATLEVLLEILAGVGTGITELMCHPARVDDDLRAGSSYVEEREAELAALCHAEVLRAVRGMGLELGSFDGVGGG
ncbi:MAG TPA: carbohydrate deacetylase [Thermoanaerobaculia bacterium]|nr:carbohydrate deacetylase [Thermoanaerobaculia bacterium]